MDNISARLLIQPGLLVQSHTYLKERTNGDNTREAVADAMGWDADELARLRNLLHQEPHVRGLGYNQYGDELDEIEEEEYLEG